MPSEVKTRLARQLHWLRTAPNLVTTPELELPQGLLGEDFHQSRQTLKAHRINARRLGLQFEELLRIYLQYHLQVTDIESNIPIREDKITLGEADLLFQYDRHWYHLEVALKFYLRQPGIEGLAGYFGPNRRDRFDLKWQHMLNHQTQILQHPSAAQMLEQRKISAIRSAVLIKGWLFQHPLDLRQDRPEPINPSHQRGWWVHQSELNSWLAQQPQSATYLLVQKPQWLHPLWSIGRPALSAKQFIEKIQETTFPTQVWVVLGVGRSRQLLSRGYVVSDDWEHSSE